VEKLKVHEIRWHLVADLDLYILAQSHDPEVAVEAILVQERRRRAGSGGESLRLGDGREERE
jgi:hypothetical protein